MENRQARKIAETIINLIANTNDADRYQSNKLLLKMMIQGASTRELKHHSNMLINSKISVKNYVRRTGQKQFFGTFRLIFNDFNYCLQRREQMLQAVLLVINGENLKEGQLLEVSKHALMRFYERCEFHDETNYLTELKEALLNPLQISTLTESMSRSINHKILETELKLNSYEYDGTSLFIPDAKKRGIWICEIHNNQLLIRTYISNNEARPNQLHASELLSPILDFLGTTNFAFHKTGLCKSKETYASDVVTNLLLHKILEHIELCAPLSKNTKIDAKNVSEIIDATHDYSLIEESLLHEDISTWWFNLLKEFPKSDKKTQDLIKELIQRRQKYWSSDTVELGTLI